MTTKFESMNCGIGKQLSGMKFSKLNSYLEILIPIIMRSLSQKSQELLT